IGLRARRAKPARRCASSSRRPSRPCDGGRGLGRGRSRGPAPTVERRRLLDGVPVLPTLRNHTSKDVLIRPVLARLILLRLAFLDADFADEDLALELFEADRAGGARLRALVFGIEPERGVENGLKREEIEVLGPGVPVGGARQDPAFPDLTPLYSPSMMVST